MGIGVASAGQRRAARRRGVGPDIAGGVVRVDQFGQQRPVVKQLRIHHAIQPFQIVALGRELLSAGPQQQCEAANGVAEGSRM